MAAGDTKPNKKIKLEKDDTFTIRHQGEDLKFRLYAAESKVELVSVSGAGTPAATESVPPVSQSGVLRSMSKASLLRMMTSPKVALERPLLEKLSRADTVVFSNVGEDVEGLKVALPSLSRLSKDMAKHGGKPLVVLKVTGKGTADSRADFDKALRSFSAGKHGLDAHVIGVPGPGRKAGA
jgi:hypothetical protein